MKEHNLFFNRFPVCPHCGFADQQFDEMMVPDMEQMEVHCLQCDEQYTVLAHIQLSYTTAKLEEA